MQIKKLCKKLRLKSRQILRWIKWGTLFLWSPFYSLYKMVFPKKEPLFNREEYKIKVVYQDKDKVIMEIDESCFENFTKRLK